MSEMTEDQVAKRSADIQARIRAAIGEDEQAHPVAHSLAQLFTDSCCSLVLIDSRNLSLVKTWAGLAVQFAERTAALTPKSVN